MGSVSMRVVQLRRGRVLKLLLLAAVSVLCLVLVYRQYRGPDWRNDLLVLSQINKAGLIGEESGAQQSHGSHPGDKPVFLGQGNKGNFEPDSYGGGSKSGDNGKPHQLRVEQRPEEEKLKGVYGFNQLVSDEISINRSPPQFLHEVVLVDDKSELEHLHDKLENEIKKPYYSKVKLVRNAEREGLIRARNNGALAATGDVVVFLDAHCEVAYNWLPPLLAPIHEDRTTLSVPVIDGINWNDFSIKPVYARGSHSRGLFEWGMLYKEGTVPAKELAKNSHHSEPYWAPTHAGGLFAIDREWFKEL